MFRRLLAPALDTLPPALRSAHDGRGDQIWRGLAQVEASRHPFPRLLCRLMRLPAPGADVPVTVIFEREADGERWLRDFAGRRYRSRLRARGGLMVERMGPATNIFRVTAVAGQLRLDLVGFRLLGVPVPKALHPRCHAIEREEAGAFRFDVPVELPLFGRVIRYTGLMERCDG